MNILNLIGVISTFRHLVPLHIRIDTEARATAEDVQQLIDYNRIRFGAVAINSIVLVYLLAQMLRDAKSEEG